MKNRGLERDADDARSIIDSLVQEIEELEVVIDKLEDENNILLDSLENANEALSKTIDDYKEVLESYKDLMDKVETLTKEL